MATAAEGVFHSRDVIVVGLPGHQGCGCDPDVVIRVPGAVSGVPGLCSWIRGILGSRLYLGPGVSWDRGAHRLPAIPGPGCSQDPGAPGSGAPATPGKPRA